MKKKSGNWVIYLAAIALVLLLVAAVKVPLRGKIIGIADHPGLQGEILFQENLIHNFQIGNTLQFFRTDYVNYPFGEDLGFAIANSLHLFCYIPLRLFMDTTESYNFLALTFLLLNIFTAYLLAGQLFRSRIIAFSAALVFGCNPYILLKLDQGFLQKVAVFWIPLYCLALLKLHDTKRWRYAFFAAVGLCLIQLTYPVYAYFAGLFTLLLCAYLFWKPQEWQFVSSRFGLILILFLGLSFLIYYAQGLGWDCLKMCKPRSHFSSEGSLNLFSLWHFFPYYKNSFASKLPLGISLSALLLAMVAFITKKGLPQLLFLVLTALVIMAAGPYLANDNHPIVFCGHKIPLPFYFLSRYLPFGGKIFFAIRIFPFINLCLALLAGYALEYLGSVCKKFRLLVICCVFLAIYILELLVQFPQLFPPRISQVNIPQFYQQIKKEDFSAVLNLPAAGAGRINNHYGYYAALSGKKMMNPYWERNLAIYLPHSNDNLALKQKFIEQLSAWDVGYIIVHRELFTSSNNTEGRGPREFFWLGDFCEKKNYPQDKITVYKVPLIK